MCVCVCVHVRICEGVCMVLDNICCHNEISTAVDEFFSYLYTWIHCSTLRPISISISAHILPSSPQIVAYSGLGVMHSGPPPKCYSAYQLANWWDRMHANTHITCTVHNLICFIRENSHSARCDHSAAKLIYDFHRGNGGRMAADNANSHNFLLAIPLFTFRLLIVISKDWFLVRSHKHVQLNTCNWAYSEFEYNLHATIAVRMYWASTRKHTHTHTH